MTLYTDDSRSKNSPNSVEDSDERPLFDSVAGNAELIEAAFEVWLARRMFREAIRRHRPEWIDDDDEEIEADNVHVTLAYEEIDRLRANMDVQIADAIREGLENITTVCEAELRRVSAQRDRYKAIAEQLAENSK